jgi:hypothetical protein
MQEIPDVEYTDDDYARCGDEEQEEFYGSNATPVSQDPNDYTPEQEVNLGNLADTYEHIKNTGKMQVSADHDKHLRRILYNIIAKVVDPADLFLKTDPNRETAGVLAPGQRNKVFISTQPSGVLAQGIAMSTGEVYVHEFVHAVTHSGLKLNEHLRKQVAVLYHVAKNNLKYNHFLSDPLDESDPAEVRAAKDRYDYIFVNPRVVVEKRYDTATGLYRTKEYSQHLDEFMTLGLTNEHFNRALTAIKWDAQKKALFSKDTWSGIVGDNIQETLTNIYDRIMSFFLNNFGPERTSTNIAQELESLAQRLAALDDKNKGVAYTILSKMDAHSATVAKFTNRKVMSIIAKYPAINIAEHVKTYGRLIEDSNSLSGQFLRDMRKHMDEMNYGFGQAIITEMKGHTDRMAPLHKILNLRGIIVDQAREAAVINIINVAKKMWSRELEQKEKIALTKGGLKTDLDSLRDHSTMDEITAMVGDESVVDGAIKDIMGKINTDASFKQFAIHYKKQAQSLGMHMAQSKTIEKVTLLNAHLIANMSNTKHSKYLSDESVDRAEALIDQMATLYALKCTPSTQRKRLHDLMVEDIGAVEGVLQMHRDAKREARYTLFDENPNKIIKGYTKEIINQRISMTIATLSAQAELMKQGYSISTPIPRDKRDPEKAAMFIYIARHGATKNYAAVIASLTNNQAKGTNSRQIQEQLESTIAYRGTDYNNQLVVSKQADLDAMMDTPFKEFDMARFDTLENFMIPKVDDTGKITEYRYMMDESTKDSLLEKHNEHDTILGAMAGQIVDKPNSAIVNSKLIQALKDMFDVEYDSRSAAYVEISPYTNVKRHREIYHMLPAKAKHNIKKIWGEDRMFVSKDVVDLAFGTRKYSVLEAFAKDPADRNFMEKTIVNFAQDFFKDKAIVTMKNVEDVIQDLVKLAKNNIIVRTFTTTLGNHMSNVMYCKSRGTGNADYSIWSHVATIGLLRYQATKKALDEAVIKLKISKGRKPTAALNQATLDATTTMLEGKIRELKNELALNPVTNVIEAGMLQSIVDDVETSNVQSPNPGIVDKLMESVNNKTPAPFVNFGKVVFLAEDTKMHKVLNDAVKMTDFVGRYVMYQQYTTKEGMSHEKAIAQVMHEFVNFNLPTHRMLEYANSMGFVWFSKYALRILKPLKDSIKEKSFEAISSFVVAAAWGVSSIWDAAPFVSKNPLQIFDDPLSAFAGSLDEGVIINAAEGMF